MLCLEWSQQTILALPCKPTLLCKSPPCPNLPRILCTATAKKRQAHQLLSSTFARKGRVCPRVPRPKSGDRVVCANKSSATLVPESLLMSAREAAVLAGRSVHLPPILDRSAFQKLTTAQVVRPSTLLSMMVSWKTLVIGLNHTLLLVLFLESIPKQRWKTGLKHNG